MADEQPVTHTYHVVIDGRGTVEVAAAKVEDRGGWMVFDDATGRSVLTAQSLRIVTIERTDAAKWIAVETA